jgi:hypothetical protein
MSQLVIYIYIYIFKFYVALTCFRVPQVEYHCSNTIIITIFTQTLGPNCRSLKISSLYLFSSNSPNRVFMWYFQNRPNTCGKKPNANDQYVSDLSVIYTATRSYHEQSLLSEIPNTARMTERRQLMTRHGARNAQFWSQKPRDKTAHERLESRLADNIKMDLMGTRWIHLTQNRGQRRIL